MMPEHPIYAEGLVKRFGKTRALDGLDLQVNEGSLLALLGPNGAGKTTAVRILSTLLQPDAGRATVAGFDVLKEPDRIKSHIGLAGQSVAIDEYLTGRENLEMIGRLYHLTARDARARAAALLEQFELGDAADRIAKTYSGGMRRRLDLGASLVALPPVLFLDEPTTGLDPRSRRQMWGVISSLISEGSTILLTTQYLEEADELSNRIAVVDAGRVIAEGTSDELKDRVGGDRIEVAVARDADLQRAAGIAHRHLAGDVSVDPAQRRISGPSSDGTSQLAALVRELDAADIGIVDLELHRPSLDDVFLTLTGHQAEPDQPAEPARRWGRRAS
jgi:ABC-2 type transport system ATP-binding protein